MFSARRASSAPARQTPRVFGCAVVRFELAALNWRAMRGGGRDSAGGRRRRRPPPPAAAAAAAAAAAGSAAPRPSPALSANGSLAHDWFEDPHANFPRSQLKYVRELGRGWFGRVSKRLAWARRPFMDDLRPLLGSVQWGRVAAALCDENDGGAVCAQAVEGEARGVAPGQATTRVVVKILHEDATPTDHMFFLHEARPYRDLRHPNVLRLVGRCLETDPFLVVLEACTSGDLKSFLSQNISTAEALSQQGVTLLMCCQVAAGLQFMHQHGFVHTDLAARNCLVTSDLTVKIGDYGISIDTFKEDYYCTSDVALPIRWCAPETLHCTDTTIETKEVTPCANVWSLGVVLWEICEFGKLPYEDLSDDEVIVKVLVEVSKCLPLPSRSCPHRHNLYHLMKLCWCQATERPALPQVLAMLNHLYGNREFASIDNETCSSQADEDFERRWETFKPNSIPVTDNHVTATSTDVHRPSSLLGSDLTDVVPPVLVTSNLASEMNVLNQGLQKSSTQPSHEIHLTPQETPFLMSDSSPLTTSPQPSLTSSSGGEIFLPSLQQRHKSPSLQNLRGSLDDLSDCNGQIHIEEDEFVKHEVINEEESRNEDLPEDNKSKTNNANETSVEPVALEPDFDSWLQGVETTDEEDAKFVRKISEAIRDLDNALALEKTSSSSSSPASSKSGSHHQSPSKDVAPIASNENVVLDFRLGPTELQNDRFGSKSVSLVQPDSLLDDSLVEKSSRDANNRATDSGTDTEDETWRKRIECGEFTAKVKEKSKSVADLMVLTHIDCSDGSDSEPPSLTWTFDRGSNSRNSFSKQRRGSSFKGGNLNTNALAFASESNIHQAVLGEEFRNTLQKLHEAQKDQRNRLGSLDLSPLNHEAVSEETLTNSADPLLPTSNFLCDADDFENMGLKIDSPTKKENNFLVDDASDDNVVESKSATIRTEAKSPADDITSERKVTVCVNGAIMEHEEEVSIVEFVQNNKEENILLTETCNVEPLTVSPPIITDNELVSESNSDVKKLNIETCSNVSQPVPSTSDFQSCKPQECCNSNEDNTDNVSVSLLPSKESSAKKCESEITFDNEKEVDLNESVYEEKFIPEVKSASTPKKISLLSDVNDSSIEASLNKNESKKVDFEGIPETAHDMETSLSSSSLILSNSDSRDATFNSSDANVNSNVSVQSGISTDSFEFVPVTSSEPKPCSTPTDPLETEHKEVSSATNNENMSNSISEGSVILGPCEDYTLDYFKGLKTISNDAGPFLSDDSDHAESANISDSSESPDEDEHNLNVNCLIAENGSVVQSGPKQCADKFQPNDLHKPESCQSLESKTSTPAEENVKDSSIIKTSTNNEINVNMQENGCVEACTSMTVAETEKGRVAGYRAECPTCDKNSPSVQADCCKASLHSFAPDSLDKHVSEVQSTSTLLVNSKTCDYPSEIHSGLGSLSTAVNVSEISSAVLSNESANAPGYFSNGKEDILSMDPDSLNEASGERGLVEASIDSIEALKENSVLYITNDLEENCGQVVEAETSTNLLSSGVESSEGKSEVSLSVSLENEVPTVVASTLGRSSDSNVEYDSSDTLVSLEQSIPEIDLQDKTLCSFDDSPSPELLEDKKAASFAFLQQEINAENLYRQKPVINMCTLEPVFPEIILQTSKDISDKDLSFVESNGILPEKTSYDEGVSNVNRTPITQLSNKVSPENIKEKNCAYESDKETAQDKVQDSDIISVENFAKTVCIGVEKEVASKESPKSSLSICKANASKTTSNEIKSDVEASCKTISHFTKDVPLEVVPNIYNNELESSESKYAPVLPCEIFSEKTNNILSHEEGNVPQTEQLCFNDSTNEFFEQKDNLEKWKQADVDILNEEFLRSQKHEDNFLALGIGLDGQEFASDFHPENDTTVDLDDGEDYGLDVAKHSTPDDERSSDSGFRDKGSLSESCEDACDEKYNLEDIEAELEETFNKGGFNYVVKGLSGDEDDLEHHTSSEELPHEHLADPDEVAPSDKDISSTDADISRSASEVTVEKKQPDNVIGTHLSPNSDVGVLSISEETSNTVISSDKCDIIDAEKIILQHVSPTGTPDLLNIETNDTPMPDVTSPQGSTNNKVSYSTCELNPYDNQETFDSDLKCAMSDGFDVDIQSRFCQEKDLMLDIGQTEFRALSPEQSPLPMDSGENSPVKKAGWFLHPQAGIDSGGGNFEDNLDDVFMSPKSTSSSVSNADDVANNENQYEPFSLNEEFVAAIRNELQEKLPCARQQNHDDLQDDGILEPEDETSQDERTDVTIHYNVYPPPLSPILEERESVSSITTTLSDNFVSRGAQQPESDSEPASPVFVLDTVDIVNAEADAKRFEEEIREALENCSFSSVDTDSFSDKDQKNKSVLLEDLEQSHDDQPSGPASENTNSNNVTIVKSTSPHSEFDDDFLVIDTETNQATLLESPKPKSHLAFIKKPIPLQEDQITEDSSPSDVKDESLVVSSDESIQRCLKLEVDPDTCLSDDEAFTPDSISPRQDKQIILQDCKKVHTINHQNEVPISSSEKSSVSIDSIDLPQSPGGPTPYLYASSNLNCPQFQSASLDVVEEISIGVANNEAAEIITELQNSGIIAHCQHQDEEDREEEEEEEEADEDDGNDEEENEDNVPIELETSTKFTCEDSSRTESDDEGSEGVSVEESSDSLKSPEMCTGKKSLSLDLSSLQQGNALKRFQSHDNICVNNPPDGLQCQPSTTIEVTGCEDEKESNLRLTDTLDLFKKKKNLQMEEGPSDRDWSVTNLEAALLSTKAPMPSPEDESWKQIPSMLAFSDLNEMMSRCNNEDDFTESYAEATSPGFPSHDNDEDLMSTSFSLKDSEDIGDCYTPDWESEDDTNEEDNNSSSSGEFIWKEGDKEASVKAVDIQASGGASKPFEGHSEFGMEVIAEEEEDEDDDEEDDGSMSSESGTEFIPSAWNSEATPNRSALRSPDKKQEIDDLYEQKKNVSFKKQKYHCVYEYPREASDSESEGTDSPSRRRWDLYQPDVDYASYADWELMEGDVAESSGPDIDTDPELPQAQPTQTFDFYKLSNVDCDLSAGVMSEDGEFYISSSARPFQFSGTNTDMFGGNGSEFFPGQLYRSSNDEDLSAPPTEIADVSLEFLPFEVEIDGRDEVSKCSEETNENSSNMKEECSDNHTNATVMLVEIQQVSPVTEDIPNECVIDDDPGETCVQNTSTNFTKEPESPGSPLDSSPTSPLSPTSGLGELRHTRDRLKLDLPTSGSAFVLEPPALNKRRSVETIKGEASLLDSGEETEDSGIESSNGTNSSKTSKHVGTLSNIGVMNSGKV
ncbi:Tyrosine-protein kinase transmembrane receptor Ror [Gryllus bimaculatus]|nr:Tyrosine-protein kinase transmembrane receptor Ror [Gryllus bimaculatus]